MAVGWSAVLSSSGGTRLDAEVAAAQQAALTRGNCRQLHLGAALAGQIDHLARHIHAWKKAQIR